MSAGCSTRISNLRETSERLCAFGQFSKLMQSKVCSAQITVSTNQTNKTNYSLIGTDLDTMPMSIQTEDMLAIEVPQQSTSADKTTKTVNFQFNRVFGMAATQNDVFQEVKEVIQVNISIFVTKCSCTMLICFFFITFSFFSFTKIILLFQIACL